MNLRNATRRLCLICVLSGLVGMLLSGCARTPPEPILPEELFKESDLPMLEQECYELLLDRVETWLEFNNDVLRREGSEERFSAEEVTVSDVTFLPYAYSFYEKIGEGQYISYLALACSYNVRVDSSLWNAEASSYNFFLLRNPRRDKTTGTLRIDESSLQNNYLFSKGWEYQESVFLFDRCTDGQSVVVSEYGTGEVIRKSYNKDAATEYERREALIPQKRTKSFS